MMQPVYYEYFGTVRVNTELLQTRNNPQCADEKGGGGRSPKDLYAEAEMA
jgi:hypothetical protein